VEERTGGGDGQAGGGDGGDGIGHGDAAVDEIGVAAGQDDG